MIFAPYVASIYAQIITKPVTSPSQQCPPPKFLLQTVCLRPNSAVSEEDERGN